MLGSILTGGGLGVGATPASPAAPQDAHEQHGDEGEDGEGDAQPHVERRVELALSCNRTQNTAIKKKTTSIWVGGTLLQSGRCCCC